MDKNKIEDISEANSNIFIILGKLFLGLVIVSLLVGIGFYLGQLYSIDKTANKDKPIAQITTSIQPEANNLKVSPTGKQAIQKQILSFKIEGKNYSLEAPKDWTVSQESDNATTDTTISNGESALIIRSNFATEGIPCGFKDAPLSASEMFPNPADYSYDTYFEFQGNQGQIYRRVNITANPSAGKSFFAICEKRQESYSQPTSFGFVTYEVPYSNNPEINSEETIKLLDSILSDLK